MQRAHSVLKDVFGFETFWPLQEKIISHILEKKDALVVMPMGGGSIGKAGDERSNIWFKYRFTYYVKRIMVRI